LRNGVSALLVLLSAILSAIVGIALAVYTAACHTWFGPAGSTASAPAVADPDPQDEPTGAPRERRRAC